MPIYKSVNKNFFKKWTPKMAYVLGFFAADGYITVNKRGGQFWCIQITDRKLLESIKKVIGSEHKISIRLPNNQKEKPSYRLQVGSIEMCDDLRKLGIGERKTFNLSIPNIPGKLFSHFVRGYFDGDGNVWTGYVHKERKVPLLVLRVVFTSCSEQFLQKMKVKLESVGILKGVLGNGKGDYSRLSYSVNGALRLHDFMYNSVYSSSLLLKRKKGVFEKFIKMRV